MRRLLSFVALALALLLGSASPSFAADVAHGGQVFSANCAACHMGGGNVVNAERTLKKEALEAYLANYNEGHESAIAYQVTNGKNAMPAFGGKLSEADISDVAAYVIEQSNSGWS
jgi:cytochrome c6